MSTNCKPGDLAMVVRMHPGCRDDDKTLIGATLTVGEQDCVAEHFGVVWNCSPLKTKNGIVFESVADYCLMRLTPPDGTEIEETEKELENV